MNGAKRKRDKFDGDEDYARQSKKMITGISSLNISSNGSSNIGSLNNANSKRKEEQRKNRGSPSMNNHVPETENIDDYVISVLKGGRKKYLRKVDFLIDEVIRKHQRTENEKYIPEVECAVPSSIGPSPRVDQSISRYWPIALPLTVDGKLLKDDSAIQQLHNDYERTSSLNFDRNSSSPLFSNSSFQNGVKNGSKSIKSFSGEITHSDWGIEELSHSNISAHNRMTDATNPNGHNYSSFCARTNHNRIGDSCFEYPASNDDSDISSVTFNTRRQDENDNGSDCEDLMSEEDCYGVLEDDRSDQAMYVPAAKADSTAGGCGEGGEDGEQQEEDAEEEEEEEEQSGVREQKNDVHSESMDSS